LSNPHLLHVAVGVLINSDNEVLVARRPDHLHQGGLLEFPGGKLEANEDRFSGLQREFAEELDLTVESAFPLKQIVHHYDEISVLLDVWTITKYSGVAQGLEGQPIYWLPLAELSASDFPAANAPIVDLLKLPRRLVITPELLSFTELEVCLDTLLTQRVEIIYLRQNSADEHRYTAWYWKARDICRQSGCKLLFSSAQLAQRALGTDLTDTDGIHCSAQDLKKLDRRPVASGQLFGASCHDLDELKRAENLGADYATLSPVLSTAKYDDAQLLGWSEFSRLRMQVSLPVYALGGLNPYTDQEIARVSGAQGIAGISGFLSESGD